ncbi:MAG: D-aminoacyl-tRNA deacylase [Candidatus Rhabdochlamydia sp.]
MGLSLFDVKLELLIISQFTLYVDYTSGRKLSFLEAASPEIAKSTYEVFIERWTLLLIM